MNACDNPKVSVNVPIYNVEKYLPKCLDSLMVQSLKNIEFILVNDGSTDASGSICEKYAELDARFRVFHKTNGGLASARQYALEKAKGEYFISCDSDDWVEPTMYAELYEKAKASDADMVICDFYYNYSDGRQVAANNIPSGCSRDALIRDVLMRKITGSTCNKMVRTDIYRQYNLSWEKDINLGEDLLMFLKLLHCPIHVAVLPKPFYHYRRIMNANTYTNHLTFETYKQLEYIYMWSLKHIDSRKFGRELFFSSFDYAFAAIRTDGMKSNYYDSFVQKCIPFSSFFLYRAFSLKGLIILFSKIFGYTSTKYVVRKLYRYYYK